MAGERPARSHAPGLAADRGPETHVVEMQRNRLLAAFVELLASHELEEARVGDICKRAGVSRRTFYEIFDGHEACFLAALDASLQWLSDELREVYTLDGGWQERMRRTLATLLETLDANPGMARMWVIQTLRSGPAVLARRAAVLEKLAEALDEGRRARTLATSPPPLTARGIVGGALSVIHAQLASEPDRPLVELTSQLTAMIVHPYLGAQAAEGELARPCTSPRSPRILQSPFKDLPIRFTYRTARVLSVIASDPGASNRTVAQAAEIADQGQTSRLLRRLDESGLIENQNDGQPKGAPNAWTLTRRGHAVHLALSGKH
jgi:AcrR family transcriptional regulator